MPTMHPLSLNLIVSFLGQDFNSPISSLILDILLRVNNGHRLMLLAKKFPCYVPFDDSWERILKL